jgi:hypothetical protein
MVILNEKGLQGEPERPAQEWNAADNKTKQETPPVKK